MVRIHRIGEHPTKFEIFDRPLELRDVVANRDERRVVALGAREIEKLAAVVEPRAQLRQRDDDLIELLLLAAKLLRAFRIAPDVGILELAGDGVEALALLIEVKDTSEAARFAP